MKWTKRIGCGLLLLIVASGVYVALNDLGVITVQYADSKNSDHQAIKASLEEIGAFQVAADDIDAVFLIPRDFQIVFSDCGQPNAEYDPVQTTIRICYELVDRLVRDYRRYAESDSALAASVWQTTLFVFYHELGHAFIDIMDLPVTGREEDAVDQLATLILLEAGEDGRDAVLRGAEWFQLNARRSGSRLAYWDEHSMDQQRYFNIVCWVYGSDPTAHQALLGREWGLPRDRAERCEGEYQRMSRGWEALLSEHRH